MVITFSISLALRRSVLEIDGKVSNQIEYSNRRTSHVYKHRIKRLSRVAVAYTVHKDGKYFDSEYTISLSLTGEVKVKDGEIKCDIRPKNSGQLLYERELAFLNFKPPGLDFTDMSRGASAEERIIFRLGRFIE